MKNLKLKIIQVLSLIMTAITTYLFYDFYYRFMDAGSVLLTVDGEVITGSGAFDMNSDLAPLFFITLIIPIVFFSIFIIAFYLDRKGDEGKEVKEEKAGME